MIRSMTGFGRARFEVEGLLFAVEVRTVNHRHLDVAVRLPRLLSALEPEVKRRLAARFRRGKAEVSVSAPAGVGPAAGVELDVEVARRYLEFAERLQRDEGVVGTLDVAALLALPGVARTVERTLPEEAVAEGLSRAVAEAAEAASAMRAAEGQALARELRERLAAVGEAVAALEARSGEVLDAARDRLRRRTEQIRRETGLGDETRLHQEIVFAVDRLDVTEELVRLRSHRDQFEAVLGGAHGDDAVGRRLEFLLQEMAREANTLGAKAGDAGLAHLVVDLKTELERIREQVQNVE